MSQKENIHINKRLTAAGLRCTTPRLALSRLLFGTGATPTPRHITAEQLYEEAQKAGASVSLATVYNTLNQFRDVGMLCEVVASPNGRHYYDTNIVPHHHFYIEEPRDPKRIKTTAKESAIKLQLIDIPAEEVEAAVDLSKLPPHPKGYAIDNLSVMIKLKSKK